MTNNIIVVSKDVSPFTKQPHRVLINVDRIVSVEECVYQLSQTPDDATVIEGCGIIVAATQGFIQQVECREPFDNVVARMELAQAGIVCEHAYLDKEAHR
jgi:hypothetical protein